MKSLKEEVDEIVEKMFRIVRGEILSASKEAIDNIERRFKNEDTRQRTIFNPIQSYDLLPTIPRFERMEKKCSDGRWRRVRAPEDQCR